MPIIDFTNPYTVLVALVLFLLLFFLAKHTKKSLIIGITLFAFLAVITGHCVEFAMINLNEDVNITVIAISMGVDFVFILLSFISYLWIDDIEAKEMNKRSIDNSLEWFWSKV